MRRRRFQVNLRADQRRRAASDGAAEGFQKRFNIQIHEGYGLTETSPGSH